MSGGRAGILVQGARCQGCLGCEVACQKAHGGNGSRPRIMIEVGLPHQGRADHYFPRQAEPLRYPSVCRHCDSPRCVDACMSGALSKREDGRIELDEERCVGCGMCVMVCSYGAIFLDRTVGKAMKCDLCGGDEPACAAACLTGALLAQVDKGR